MNDSNHKERPTRTITGMLGSANALLRSVSTIIERKGQNTNWEALGQNVNLALKQQHEIMYPTNTPPSQEDRIALSVRSVMEEAGIEFTNDRKDTPNRYARFLKDFTSKIDPPAMTLFDLHGSSEMLVERDIRVCSLCEHHMLPFFGYAYIGYIPSRKILGVSKFSRLVSHFATSLTTQETLTNQIADYLQNLPGLDPYGVGVAIDCIHTCMTIRGVRESRATTRTTAFRGNMSEGSGSSSRQEFLDIAKSLKAF